MNGGGTKYSVFIFCISKKVITVDCRARVENSKNALTNSIKAKPVRKKTLRRHGWKDI